jgi:hypothetical protein
MDRNIPAVVLCPPLRAMLSIVAEKQSPSSLSMFAFFYTECCSQTA